MDAHLVQLQALVEGARDKTFSLQDIAGFERALTKLLDAEHRAAPARLVFYEVAQRHGQLDAEGDLGKAARRLVGVSFPLRDAGDHRVLYAGDLYWWWKKHEQNYSPFPMLSRWEQSEPAREVIEVYRKVEREGFAQPKPLPPDTPRGLRLVEVQKMLSAKGFVEVPGALVVLARTFSPGVEACASKLGGPPRFGVLLNVKPDAPELSIAATVGEPEPALYQCIKPIYEAGSMPEAERYDGLLSLSYTYLPKQP